MGAEPGFLSGLRRPARGEIVQRARGYGEDELVTMESDKIYTGDCLEIMRDWPDECVDCVVTSPPYWGLRDYGTASWEGGDAECDHRDDRQADRHMSHNDSEQRHGRTADECKLRDGVASVAHIFSNCGARRVAHQIGLHQTPDLYVAKMVEVFRCHTSVANRRDMAKILCKNLDYYPTKAEQPKRTKS